MSTYKGTTITRTQTTTDTRNGVRNVYRLSGEVSKPEGMRPLLTSVAAAKRYITETLERRAGNRRDWNDWIGAA